jgi:hypothetical protein
MHRVGWRLERWPTLFSFLAAPFAAARVWEQYDEYRQRCQLTDNVAMGTMLPVGAEI